MDHGIGLVLMVRHDLCDIISFVPSDCTLVVG